MHTWCEDLLGAGVGGEHLAHELLLLLPVVVLQVVHQHHVSGLLHRHHLAEHLQLQQRSHTTKPRQSQTTAARPAASEEQRRVGPRANRRAARRRDLQPDYLTCPAVMRGCQWFLSEMFGKHLKEIMSSVGKANEANEANEAICCSVIDTVVK